MMLNQRTISETSLSEPAEAIVLEGIDLIYYFTTIGQQWLFPRKIMIKFTKGQMTVYSTE